MDKFREKFIEIFNKCNDITDSSDSSLETNLLELNLRIFDYVNNKIQIVLNEDLNCEHTLEYKDNLLSSIVSKIDIKNNINQIYDFIYFEMVKHIDEELTQHKIIYLNMFVYSIVIEDNLVRFNGNFKFKK